MSVLALLKEVKPLLGWDNQNIDNAVFRLHTKTTVLFILVCSILVTAQTFIGDPIDCVVNEVPQKVMDTYCWIHSTFTLPHRITDKTGEAEAAPGVGNQRIGEEETTHKYYQWVCFTLFFQAMLFYIPRFLWLMWEKKKMKELVPNELVYNVTDARMPAFPIPRGMLKEDVVQGKLTSMKDFFVLNRQTGSGLLQPGYFRTYFVQFTFCEFLTLVNVVFQIFFIDIFLGGMFSTYGKMVWEISNKDPEDRDDPMNLVFPKVAKCTFRKAGPSGTIQLFDGLCVLPVNIINEKIYIFLWYWLIILTIITCIHLSYRLITVCSRAARKAALRARANLLVDNNTVDRITDRIGVGEWFFLCQLGSNLDPHIFKLLLEEIDKSLLSPNRAVANGKVEKIA